MKPLQRNPDILEMNIASTSDYINSKVCELARLTYRHMLCYSFDRKGNLLIRDNDYQKRINDVNNELVQAQRTLIRFQEELKELRGEE